MNKTIFLMVLAALLASGCGSNSEKEAADGAASSGDANAQGAVVLSYPDGGRYEGFLRNGKRHGQGTYYYPTGDRYAGSWTSNLRNGWGVYHWVNGAKFEGEWRNGRQHGKGVLTYADGGVMEATWSNGRMLAAGETMEAAVSPPQPAARAPAAARQPPRTEPRQQRQLTCADTGELWLEPEANPKWLETVESLSIRLIGNDCDYTAEQNGGEGFMTQARQARFTDVAPGQYDLVIEGRDRNTGPFSINVQLTHPGPATLRCTLDVTAGSFSCR